MSWEKVKKITDEDLSAGKIANLPNHPNRGAGFGATGLTAQQLKAYFDKNVTLLRDTINNIIEEGDPNTIAGKIKIGSINGWDDIATLYDFIVAMNEGGLSDKFFVKFEDEEQLYILNEFLQSLQKNKVQSKQGGENKGKVYIIDENSDDALLGYSEDATPHSIVKRTEEGDILVPEGSTNDDAAISRKDAAALLSEAVTKDVFQEEQNRTNTFVKSAKVEYDEANHVIRLTFTDGNGETDTSSVDLPLEMAFVGARLEDGNLVFTLQNGQEVSVPIGDVLGGLVTSGTLAQSLSGNEEDKAPSVKAVNEGLGGKVDKITKIWQAYTTDDNGNTVPKKLAANPAAGGVVLYNAGGIVKTNAPVADNDASNKKYVDDGFVAKTNNSWKIYGTGEGAAPKEYSVTYKARKSYLAEYGDVNVGTEANDGYLVTCDPVNPYHSANKKYVDRKCRDLQQGVYNALGVLYTFESVKLGSPYNKIPDRALSIAYLESIGDANVYSNATGKPVLVGTTDILAIHIYDANGERLSMFGPTAPQYIKLPEGAVSMVFEYREPTVTVWDTLEIDASIKYQIKVGA